MPTISFEFHVKSFREAENRSSRTFSNYYSDQSSFRLKFIKLFSEGECMEDRRMVNWRAQSERGSISFLLLRSIRLFGNEFFSSFSVGLITRKRNSIKCMTQAN